MSKNKNNIKEENFSLFKVIGISLLAIGLGVIVGLILRNYIST